MKSGVAILFKSALMALAVLVIAVPGQGLASKSTTIKDLRYSSSNGYTRVVVELSGSTNFAVNRLRNPDRLYIDLRGSSVRGEGDKSIRVSDGLLKAIRLGQYDRSTVRVVMDLMPGNTYKVFRLEGPPRVVVDFFKATDGDKRMPGAGQGKVSDTVRLARVKLRELERKKALLKESLRGQTAKEAKGGADIPDAAHARQRENTVPAWKAGKSVATAPSPAWQVAEATKSPSNVAPSSAKATHDRGSNLDESASGGTTLIKPLSQAVSIEREHQARLLAVARAKALAKSSASAKNAESAKPRLEVRKAQERMRHKPSSSGGGFALYKVVLDAGHGGRDPGAIGYGGIEEKDLVLDIARRVKRKLVAMGGYEVQLTRNNDRFLELEDRAQIANEKNADIFVSIHANASRNKRTRGLETYFLNRNSDEDTIKIAARENAIPIDKMKDAMNSLDYILASMAAQHKQEESWDLAESVQKNMYSAVAGRYDGVLNKEPRKGPFYVLYGARMPSVLVEASYITNKTEAIRLKTSTYRDYIAGGIARGINEYLKMSAAAADVAKR